MIGILESTDGNNVISDVSIAKEGQDGCVVIMIVVGKKLKVP